MSLLESFHVPRRTPRPSRTSGSKWRTRGFDHELERRITPSTLTTLQFQIPADVANMGVQLGLFGNAPLAQGQSTIEQQYLAEPSAGVYAFQDVPTSGSLALITLANPSTTNTLPITVSIPIPAQQLLAGAAVMFVGPNKGVPIQTSGGYSTGFVAVPTTTTNPNDVFSLFELTNTEPTSGQYSLDVDISEIDQFGFTYTVTSSNAAPYPLSTVGTSPTRSTFFTEYQNTFTNSNQAFLESLALGQNSNAQQLRLVAPQTILGTFEKSGPSLISAGAQGTGGNGGLTAGTAYYYLITAVSATGETLPSANLAYAGGIVNNTSSVVLDWQPYTGIQTGTGQNNPFVSGSTATTGYNIYRGVGQAPDGSGAHPPALDQFQLIGTAAGAGTSTFTDPGLTPTSQTPPSNSYGFDPLSTYFTPALNSFFTYYTTHTFTYTQSPQAGGYGDTTFSGTVASIVPDWEPAGTNLPYTVLRLTGSGGEFNGVTFNIYDPLFSTNTNGVTGLSPMPSWLSAASSATETPAQMVFACDGVFATNTIDPDVQNIGATNPGVPVGDAQKSIGNIENVIVSAFNRGLATLSPNLGPNQWVNPLQFTADPTPGSGGALTPNHTYYYVMTSVLTSGGETVPTREVAATLGSGQGSVTLNWAAVDPSVASSFNIYRGTASGQETLIGSVANTTPPPTSFVDPGGQTPSTTMPPYQFYSPGSTSNLYSAFLHQNSTTNPATGISVNGLVYGYPFDDQGNFSTNIQYPTGNLPTTVTFALGSFAASPTPSPIAAIAGTPFAMSFSGTTGETIHFSSSDARAHLPGNYTFSASDNGSHVFSLTLFEAGSAAVTITGPGDSFTQTARVTVAAGAASQIEFVPVPRTEFVRTPFAVMIEALDAYGNLAPTASGLVTLRSPDLFRPIQASFQNGMAGFTASLKRAGRFFLRATSPYGTAVSSPIGVSNATYFAVHGNKFVAAGRPLHLSVLARWAYGLIDHNYDGTVDVYDGGQLIGSGVARSGVAEITVIPPAEPVDQWLVFRDSLKSSVAGRKLIVVTGPRGPLPLVRQKA